MTRHVRCERPWKREFVTRGHRYEFCTVLETELSDDGQRTGDYMVAVTDEGREFIAVQKMGHYMEGDQLDLQCYLTNREFHVREGR